MKKSIKLVWIWLLFASLLWNKTVREKIKTKYQECKRNYYRYRLKQTFLPYNDSLDIKQKLSFWISELQNVLESIKTYIKNK